METLRVGRNEPCPCGSGKKFKHCCLHGAANGYGAQLSSYRPPPAPAPQSQPVTPEGRPLSYPTWKELAYQRDDARLAENDIAFLNLLCAAGLPGAEKIDIHRCIMTLNEWAERVREGTAKVFWKYERHPAAFRNSPNFFRVLAMITILQRDLGVRYNAAKIPRDVPLDTADTFIHGVIQGDGGTCCSLPVVYTAVGRRLGYPIKLVSSQTANFGHLFCRWDDGMEKFNIEATAPGLSSPSDDDYRADFRTLPAEIEQMAQLLVSMTPRQEFADFLMQRAARWLELGDFGQSAEALIFAHGLAPENVYLLGHVGQALNRWMDSQDERKPPNFPQVVVLAHPRLFPDVPEKVEGDFLALEAIELALANPEMERNWWGPMRNRQPLVQLPKTMQVFRSPVEGRMNFEMVEVIHR